MAKLLVTGTIEGVDFTKSGQFKRDDGEVVKYNSSIKLLLSTFIDIEKQGIKTKTKRVFKLSIPTTDDGLEMLVEQYNKMIGKNIEAEFIPNDGQVFSLLGDIRIINK